MLQKNGGAGGTGIGSNAAQYDGGGAGNPGGVHSSGGNSNNGENGTGGLLVLYGNNFANNGNIESKGSDGGYGADARGGASGGGSINVFYKDTYTNNKNTLYVVTGGNGNMGDDGNCGGSGTVTIKCTGSENQYQELNAESLLSGIEKIQKNGLYKIKVKDETYNIHLYKYDGNQNWTTDMKLGTYEDFETSKAINTIVIKINGNLTIGSNVTISAITSPLGYGGPKGLIIYCTGDFENNGTISMTARGADAEGQNIYLYKNNDETYEYVPKIGGTGGVGKSSTLGEKGKDGTEISSRATGGRTEQEMDIVQ